MTQTAHSTTVDLCEVTPRERHALAFSTFRGLRANESMEIINDHDPRPLYFQFQAEQPGTFSWDYLQSGPDVWRVRIVRLARPHGNGQCCGSCGGA